MNTNVLCSDSDQSTTDNTDVRLGSAAASPKRFYISHANDLTAETAEVTEFRQNERNFQNRGNEISEMEIRLRRRRGASEFQTTDAADDTDVHCGTVAAGIWLESLTVASDPWQRRPRRNNLLFNHEEHEAHGDWRSADCADFSKFRFF